MPGRRIEMRKLKEILRLRLQAGLSNRKIALCTGAGKSAVSKHVARTDELELEWPRIETMPDEALEALLYANEQEERGAPEFDTSGPNLGDQEGEREVHEPRQHRRQGDDQAGEVDLGDEVLRADETVG
jgi:hypothetical protein